MTIGDLIATLTGQGEYRIAGSPPVVETVIDSRQAGPNKLFVAFVGERQDGHHFVEKAFAQGAVAALVACVDPRWAVVDCRGEGSADWDGSLPVQLWVNNTMTALQQIAHAWREQHDVRVIGITGSVGKTTSKEVIAHLLQQRFCTLKSAKNQNNEIGLPLTLLQLTPEHEYAVLEMGMYVPGEIKLLCDIARPNIGVMTLVGTVHLERTGTLEALVAGKRELVEAIPADGLTILNADEPLVMGMASASKARIFTYGTTPSADLWADEIILQGLRGVRFTAHYRSETHLITTPMIGRHSVLTALRAIAVALEAGLTWSEIQYGLQTYRDQLRLTVLEGPQGATLIDDSYNASPESTLAALDLLAAQPPRRIAILGDMLELGSAMEAGHRQVGRRATSACDLLIAVGLLGRVIADEALAQGMMHVHWVESAEAALPLLHTLSFSPQDTILVKGSRGARLETISTALHHHQE